MNVNLFLHHKSNSLRYKKSCIQLLSVLNILWISQRQHHAKLQAYSNERFFGALFFLS